jgi:HTH-type transcriptional regulator/antitoxin HigA
MDRQTMERLGHPVIYIEAEMENMGWDKYDLAKKMDRSPRFIDRLLSAEQTITNGAAKALGRAFGTTPYYWTNLQRRYNIDLAKSRNKRD